MPYNEKLKCHETVCQYLSFWESDKEGYPALLRRVADYLEKNDSCCGDFVIEMSTDDDGAWTASLLGDYDTDFTFDEAMEAKTLLRQVQTDETE